MLSNPTTIEQQLEFITELRQAFDREERERVAMIRTPEQTAQLLKDIHENLIGVRNWQHGQKVDLCTDCNKPLTTGNYADTEFYDVVLTAEDNICIPCADKRLERLEKSSMGLP